MWLSHLIKCCLYVLFLLYFLLHRESKFSLTSTTWDQVILHVIIIVWAVVGTPHVWLTTCQSGAMWRCVDSGRQIRGVVQWFQVFNILNVIFLILKVSSFRFSKWLCRSVKFEQEAVILEVWGSKHQYWLVVSLVVRLVNVTWLTYLSTLLDMLIAALAPCKKHKNNPLMDYSFFLPNLSKRPELKYCLFS